MNEELQLQLVRQLKSINRWMRFFGIILIAIMGTLMVMIFQIVTFVRATTQQIDSLKTSAADSINVQKKICEGTDAASTLIKERTTLCR